MGSSVSMKSSVMPKIYRFGVFPPGNPKDHLKSAITLGITQPRVILSWEMFEPEKGKFNYTIYDVNLKIMQKAGMKPIVTIICDSSWATKSGDSKASKASPPNDMEDYRKYVATFVERYKNKVQYWQIGNEVYEYSKYWDGSKEEYIELLKASYDTIKELDKNSKVVLQGFANQMFIEMDQENQEAQSFFEYIMSHGDYFDVIDFHQYYEPDGVNLIVSLICDEMHKQGYVKEIICTEAGDLDIRLFGKYLLHLQDPSIPNVPIIEKLIAVPAVEEKLREMIKKGIVEQDRIDFAIFLSNNELSRPILEKYQAQNIVKRVVLTFYQGVESFNWVAMMNESQKPVDWFFAIMGLMDDEGNHKPSYYSYKLLIEKLSGFTKVEKITNYGVFKFEFGGKCLPIYIAWNNNGGEVTIDLSKEISGKVKVYDIITFRGKTNEDVVPRYVEPSSIVIGNTPIIFTKKQ